MVDRTRGSTSCSCSFGTKYWLVVSKIFFISGDLERHCAGSIVGFPATLYSIIVHEV